MACTKISKAHYQPSYKIVRNEDTAGETKAWSLENQGMIYLMSRYLVFPMVHPYHVLPLYQTFIV